MLVGAYCEIICEGRTQDIDQLIRNLDSDKFRKARCGLHQFIENHGSRFLSFHIQKIIGYKSESYEIFV